MAYTKTNWINGETPCSAENMNNIENGIENSLLKESVKIEKTESDNDVYSCNYINYNMQKHMISASFTTDIDPTPQQYVEISNWNAIETVGNKLSIKNGKIVVGKGVSKIKIMGVLGTFIQAKQLIYIYSKKNGNNVFPWVVVSASDYNSIAYNTIISVQEGDIISISTYGQQTYKLENQKSLFIFEVVE